MATAIMVLAVVFAINQMSRQSRWRGADHGDGGARFRELRQELEARDADIDALHARVAELENRLDFTERLLAQHNGAEQLTGRTPTP